MTKAHIRYILIDNGIFSIVFNIVLNGAIAWMVYHSLQIVQMWGGTKNIAGDIFATSFLLPFLICLIVTPLAHKQVRRGRLPNPGWNRKSNYFLSLLPKSTILRAILFGIIGVILFTPATIGIFKILDIIELHFITFFLFKALFAGMMAGIIAPIVAISALGDTKQKYK